MAEVGDIQVCVAVDPDTHDCTGTAWMPAPTFLPPMSHSDALPILGAIVGLWALAFAIRMARNVTNAGAG